MHLFEKRPLERVLAPLNQLAQRTTCVSVGRGAGFVSGTTVLSSPPKARPRPFELILETPQAAPAYLKDAAFIAALQTILVRYRELMAYAPNL